MDRIIDQRRKLAAQDYPSIYKNVIEKWNQDGEDAFWLIYAANYLFRWGGARWAIDPLTIAARIPAKYPLFPTKDFAKCDFLVLTHRHADHLDLQLLNKLSDLDILWIIPEFLLDEVRDGMHLPDRRIIVPKSGEPLEISGIKILPLEGSHWENHPKGQMEGIPNHGVPSYSYLFEVDEKKWFIPGDIRSYDRINAPSLGPLDGLISHVWLGRRSALIEPPPLLEEFCNYQLEFDTKRIVLTHLDEWGRDETDLWTAQHADLVINNIHAMAPSISVTYALTGQFVPLS